MTTINLDYSGNVLTDDQKGTLVDRITEAFAQVEVGTDSPAIRRGFMTIIRHVDSEDHFLGPIPATGPSGSGRCVSIAVRVMAGPWTDGMKSELFHRVDMIVRDILQMPKQGMGEDVWMTIVEVPEGGWGLGGRTVSIRDLEPLFADDRRSRIRAYLETRVSKPRE